MKMIMKKCMVVTGVIDVDNSFGFTYSPVRSAFTNEERLKQTVATIDQLHNLCDENTKIYLLVCANQPGKYLEDFSPYKNVVYVDFIKQFPEEYKIVTTHPHKSYGEMTLQITFFDNYKQELQDYDYFFKLSGRYIIEDHFDLDLCNTENLNKFLFKKPTEFNWDNNWNYHLVDRRNFQGNNKLNQYCTIFYGWGREKHSVILNVFKSIADVTNNKKTMQYDVELLLYFFTRWYQDEIVDLSTIVFGWLGTDAQFVRY